MASQELCLLLNEFNYCMCHDAHTQSSHFMSWMHTHTEQPFYVMDAHTHRAAILCHGCTHTQSSHFMSWMYTHTHRAAILCHGCACTHIHTHTYTEQSFYMPWIHTHTEQSHLDPNDPRNSSLLRLVESIPSGFEEERHFRLVAIDSIQRFCCDEEFDNNRRFKLLELRHQGVRGASEGKGKCRL